MKKLGLLDRLAEQHRTFISNLRLQPTLKWEALGDLYHLENKEQYPLKEWEEAVSYLLGCEVRDADTGKPYGKLCDITETGATREYHIRFADGKVRLAPDIPQVVLRLAPEEGVIEIRPLAGLFDDVTEDDYEV